MGSFLCMHFCLEWRWIAIKLHQDFSFWRWSFKGGRKFMYAWYLYDTTTDFRRTPQNFPFRDDRFTVAEDKVTIFLIAIFADTIMDFGGPPLISLFWDDRQWSNLVYQRFRVTQGGASSTNLKTHLFGMECFPIQTLSLESPDEMCP